MTRLDSTSQVPGAAKPAPPSFPLEADSPETQQPTEAGRELAQQPSRQELIARAAYFRAERRGFMGGDPVEDWLIAEAEVDRVIQGRTTPVKPAQTFEEALSERLREWDEEFDHLATRAHKAKTRARSQIERQLSTLKEKRGDMQDQLQTLRERGEGAWADMREGLEKAWGDIRGALDKVAARFHEE